MPLVYQYSYLMLFSSAIQYGKECDCGSLGILLLIIVGIDPRSVQGKEWKGEVTRMIRADWIDKRRRLGGLDDDSPSVILYLEGNTAAVMSAGTVT
jgi:hypothetical protein